MNPLTWPGATIIGSQERTVPSGTWPPGGTSGASPARGFAARYLSRLWAAGTRDPEVHLAFLQVFTALRTPLSLYAPSTFLRVLMPRPPRRDSRQT
ncbi:hypothetical protein GCM10010176_046300 [Nonomuraea spiralis]|nr:hypothetical protein GCM10010176_046300 [Nonomuraea spiralis]